MELNRIREEKLNRILKPWYNKAYDFLDNFEDKIVGMIKSYKSISRLSLILYYILSCVIGYHFLLPEWVQYPILFSFCSGFLVCCVSILAVCLLFQVLKLILLFIKGLMKDIDKIRWKK